MTNRSILGNARLAGGQLANVVIVNGCVSSIESPGRGEAARNEYRDLSGRLLLPAFVEGHIHLDKTLLGLPFISHIATNSLSERIEAEKKLRRDLPLSIEARGAYLVHQAVDFGTSAMRSHVDIDREVGLDGLHSLLRLKESLRDIIDLQIVAFPQSGILRQPGVYDLLDQAIAEGADLVGGLDPAGIDGDVEGHLDAVFSIAERHGVGVDIHLHDPGALGCFELRQIAARTKGAGLQGNVTVSHAYALGEVDADEFGRTAEALAEADVALMTNGPGFSAMPPVKNLAAAGVTVFAGSDNIRDAWWPYGNGDMLERAMMIGYRQNFRSDEDLCLAFDMATVLPARRTGLGCDGVRVGARADFVALLVNTIPEAVVERPRDRLVFKRGRLVAGGGTAAEFSKPSRVH